MRTPKGFGKRYFSLASIQAHSVEPVLHAQIARTETFTCNGVRESDESPPLDDEEVQTLCLHDDRPCHCECYFKGRTRRTLIYSKNLCYRRCNCRFYSFRRSGIHPPTSYM